MSQLLFINYPKCGTCQKAKKWLENNNITFLPRDIIKDNPSDSELYKWIEISGLPAKKFFNTSGNVYKENNLKDKVATATKEELITILASNGMVVKRPILVNSNFVLVGFNESEWEEKLLKK